jgi:O-6-methylguanine DNA methyltransferase
MASPDQLSGNPLPPENETPYTLTVYPIQTPTGEGWIGLAGDVIRYLSLGSLDIRAVQTYWKGPIKRSTVCPISTAILEKAALGKVSLPMEPRGTPFQTMVWDALREIPAGQTCDYKTLAGRVATESHARAVGTAVAANPIGWLIPCHRVVPGTGSIGNYRWGSRKKKALLEWELEQHPGAGTELDGSVRTLLLRAERFEEIARSTAEIAHDLNNMLAPIRMATDLLEHHNQNPTLLGYIEMIRVSTHNATELLHELLKFARDSEPGNAETFSVPKLLEKIVQSTGPAFPKRIRLIMEYTDGLPPLQMDPTLFQRVVVNLLLNARDAISARGTVRIKASIFSLTTAVETTDRKLFPGEYLKLAISDNGCGIPAELQDRIFEPFFTTKSTGKGSGIGLASVYAAVAKSGGFMKVESIVGEGTQFEVFFPIDQNRDQ